MARAKRLSTIVIYEKLCRRPMPKSIFLTYFCKDLKLSKLCSIMGVIERVVNQGLPNLK